MAKEKDESSAAQFRAMEERLSGRGNENNTFIPVVVKTKDADGKTIFQNVTAKDAKMFAKTFPKDFSIINDKLHVNAMNIMLKQEGVFNEKAYVKEKPEGGYKVAPGKVVYAFNATPSNPFTLLNYKQNPGIFIESKNFQIIKDSKVIEKIQSGDISNYYNQKDFLLKTEPNYPKTKDGMEAYQRSARRQISKLDKEKALRSMANYFVNKDKKA
jgi:hypothetical protein